MVNKTSQREALSRSQRIVVKIGSRALVQKSGRPDMVRMKALVKDIARVSIGGVPRQGVAGQDGDDDIVYGMVLMRKGENASVVLDAIKSKLDEIGQTTLENSP